MPNVTPTGAGVSGPTIFVGGTTVANTAGDYLLRSVDGVLQEATGSIPIVDGSVPSPVVGEVQLYATEDEKLRVMFGDGTNRLVSDGLPANNGEFPVDWSDADVAGSAVDNTMAFTALEAEAPGCFVDLKGRTYTVSAVPTGAQYYNGGWNVGGVIYPASYRKMYGPLDGQSATVARLPGSYHPAGLWWDPATQFLWRADVIGPAHDTSDGSRLDVGYSRDHGGTWEGFRTIFSDTTDDEVRGGAFSVVADGRWLGVICTCNTATPTVRKIWTLISDDSGTTWTTTDITAQVASVTHFLYGLLQPGPSGDPEDWIITSYASAPYVLRTLDNGDTWSDSLLKSATGLPGTPNETSLVRIPDDRWMAFVRMSPETAGSFLVGATYVINTIGSTDFTLIGAASNTVGVIFTATGAGAGTGTAQPRFCYVTTSTDFSTWSAWVSTGVPLGSNIQWPLYDGGRLHLNIIIRDAAFLGTTYDQRYNSFYSYSCEADAAFADPAVFGNTAPQLLGTLTSRGLGGILMSCRFSQNANDIGAPWVTVMAAGQGRGTTTQITQTDVVIITQIPVPLQSIDTAREVVQVVENPIFQEWPTRVVTLPAGQFLVGTEYTIVTVGTTDFTLIGAASNTVGVVFTATGAGSGTGTARGVADAPFTAFTTDQGLAGRWRSIVSGATMTVEKVALTQAQTLAFCFHPIYGMRITSSGADFAGVMQRWTGSLTSDRADAYRAARLIGRGGDIVCRIYGIGTMPTDWRVAVLADGVSWGAGLFPRPAATNTDRGWVSEIIVACGELPVDWNALSTVQIGMDCNTSTAAYDFTLVGVFLFPRGCEANGVYAAAGDTRERVDFYCRNLPTSGANIYYGDTGVVLTATTARVTIQNRPIFPTTVSVAMSAQADWDIAAVANYNATYTFTVSQTQTIFNATIAGATAGEAAALVSSAAAKIVFDTGF